MFGISSCELDSGWYILMRAHDHIWRDRSIPLRHRLDVCNLLVVLAYYEQQQEKEVLPSPDEGHEDPEHVLPKLY